MIGIIYSEKDLAGRTMASILRNELSRQTSMNVFLYQYHDEVIYADGIDRELPKETEYLIMLSKHSAMGGKPTLSVHTPGNPSDEYSMGGRPRKVALANPCLVGNILRNMYKYVSEMNLIYDVTLEVTHHGPTEVDKPITFVEIGPNEAIWRDKKAAYIAVKAVLDAIDMGIDKCVKLVGFGGPHYAPIFVNLLLREKSYGIGHIVSKYVLTECYRDIIDLVLARNGGVDKAVINWKGLRGGIRQCIYNYLRDLGIDVLKI